MELANHLTVKREIIRILLIYDLSVFFNNTILLEHTACNDATAKSLQNYDITLFWDHGKVANKSVIPFTTNVYGGGVVCVWKLLKLHGNIFSDKSRDTNIYSHIALVTAISKISDFFIWCLFWNHFLKIEKKHATNMCIFEINSFKKC